MELRIPRRHEKGFLKLLRCPDERFQGILDALENAQPTILLANLASEVASRSGAPVEELRDIFESLGGLYLLLEEKDVTRESLVNDVSEALQVTENKELHLEGLALATFRDRLTRLLSFEGVLGITSKAMDVKLQHERWFCRARAITDVRPVFPFRSEGTPSAFMIAHTLRIRYHETKFTEANEFCVALDSAAIDELVKVLERAKRKEDTLKLVFREANLVLLEGTTRCV